MEVVYHLIFDEAMCAKIVSRYFKQRPRYGRPEYQMAGFALLISIFCVVFAIQEPEALPFSISLSIFGWVTAFFGLKAIRRVIVDHIHLSHFRESGDVVLNDNGLSGTSRSNEKWSLPWGTYSRAVRFSDGILLLRRRAIRWLPDDALVSGAPDDVIRLISKTLPIRLPT